MESFKTVKGEASSEFTEKRSKFICYAKHILTKDEAENYINSIKSRHWDAKHNVYAYRIRQPNFSKASDDGEPQGSAGVPIAFTLEKMGLQNIVIVITRYFGGILLGVGGLTRAYSYGARLSIETCGIVNMIWCTVVKIKVGYDVFEKIRNIIQRFHAKISNCTYTNYVEALIYIDEKEYLKLIEVINELSCGNAEMRVINNKFCCID